MVAPGRALYANLPDEAATEIGLFVEYLEQVLGAEAALGGGRSREVLIRLAAFPSVKALEQFDFKTAPPSSAAKLHNCQVPPSSLIWGRTDPCRS